MKNFLIRASLLAVGFAVALPVAGVATSPAGTDHTDATVTRGRQVAAIAPTGGSVQTFASDDDARVLELRRVREEAHATEVARRVEVQSKLLDDPLVRPLGELIGKYLDVPRAKLAATPEDIAAFKELFADADAGARFAERALELLPREGFGFERSAVLAGLDSLIDRGLETRVVPVMIAELERTVVAASESNMSGTLDLGLAQIAQRSVLRAPGTSDATAVGVTARAMLANSHPTVTNALARQLVARRPQLKDTLVAELSREGYPIETIAWEETSNAQ